MTTKPKEYVIPAVNMDRLTAEIEKLNKRAKKLGTAPIRLTTVRTETRTRTNGPLKFAYEYTVHVCTVDGETPKLNGWTLVSILEPQANGEMLVREVPGQTCPPRFRSSDLRCDHCNLLRKRSKVYVLSHATGDKQVGKSCLKDFLGGADPEGLVAGAEYLLDFANMAGAAEDEGWGGGRTGQRAVAIHEFVTLAAALIRRLGWTSRSAAKEDYEGGKEPTAALAWWLSTTSPATDKYVEEFVKKNRIEVMQADADLAAAAIKWAAAIDPAGAESTYLHDLGVCCRQEYVTAKTNGFVASCVGAFQRAEGRRLALLKPKAVNTKTHVGVKGERRVFEGLTITFVKDISGQFPKTMAKFNDSDGNVLVWFASGFPDWLEMNKTVTVTATVKEHGQYNGVPQTILNRVAPVEQPEPVGV